MNERLTPSSRTLRHRKNVVTYADMFEIELFAPELTSARAAFERFCSAMPPWAKWLFALARRRRLPFLFESREAVVFGFGNRHLTVRSVLSVRRGEGDTRLVRLDSAVVCHDRHGRVQRRLLAPAHRQLARATLRRMKLRTGSALSSDPNAP
jgi:hypothetical protein